MRSHVKAWALWAAVSLSFVAALGGVGRAQAPEAASTNGDTRSSYFILTKLDARECVWPLCGGYFVKQVNKPNTRCADGTWQQQCYAAQLDASTTGWSEKQMTLFAERFSQRQALVRGTLQPMAIGEFKVGVLVIDEGWLGQSQNRPRGMFYGLTESGVTCVASPCLSIRERRLNRPWRRLIAEVDLAASGAAEDQVAAGYKALSEPAGILAAGKHDTVFGPSGQGPRLVASEFYLRLAAEEGQICGGFQGLACPRGQFCDVNGCGADLIGACRLVPKACTKIYDPVCGCDGLTYGNDCERQAAEVPLDHPGICKQP